VSRGNIGRDSPEGIIPLAPRAVHACVNSLLPLPPFPLPPLPSPAAARMPTKAGEGMTTRSRSLFTTAHQIANFVVCGARSHNKRRGHVAAGSGGTQ